MPKGQIPLPLAERLRECLVGAEDILFAYLYGSALFDPDLPGSDIDIAAYLMPSDLKQYSRREKELTDLMISQLHTDKVDLRVLNVLPLVVQYRILRDGLLLFSRDEPERVDFETKVMIRFFELKPYLDEYTRMLTLRIRGQ